MALYLGNMKVIINNYKHRTPTGEIVAINVTTNEGYDDLQIALNEAKANETINLVKDIYINHLCVKKNVSFDLNGHVLNAFHVSCYGNIIDSSDGNSGMLKVPLENFLIHKNNSQLPVRNGDGYQFFEVIKFNEIFDNDTSTFKFQPFIEPSAHSLLLNGKELTGISIGVAVSWYSGYDNRIQHCFYKQENINNFINSYNAETEKYGRMFTLYFNGNTELQQFENLVFKINIVSETGVEITSNGVSVTITV